MTGTAFAGAVVRIPAHELLPSGTFLVGAVTMVLGQTDDALGYIIESFEHDLTASLATEYGTQTGEYEEVFAIDRCFGDHVLETLLESTAALGAGR